MLIHPQFDPVAIHLGPLAIRWYGLMYLVGFIGGLLICRWRLRLAHIRAQGWVAKDIDDILFYIVLGVILGGRLGYVVFYKASWYLAHPLDIFKVWEGGMSFHGGFIGVALAIVLFARKRGFRFFQVTDFVAPAVPLGLATGRFGNFINGELWGRVTSPNAPWAMGFQAAAPDDREWLLAHPEQAMRDGLFQVYQTYHGMLPRHPSQLYEMALEGVVLLIALLIFGRKSRPLGAVTALFVIGYGLSRFVIEFAREPDDFLGLLTFGLSMGQWLSLPMIAVGAALMFYAYRKRPAVTTAP
ncbi:prolipoprotein diacylglyceryl transferase [Chitinasiproducens palmae]|uniref:Phosphatidylglycerol--prolipoprotein diacylglyceryl transferase n=1 Tax=Chitinasiproducens palmae TaxID=1770053 RepID=A0A1H2PP30_9BURK|nr:prolipoprotein diacylglyceryl transferase [Chitinasiproducens palmae]SDV48013.1 Prolipoprotein diacylglyceryl transferase [Chitinasiproducens palmae]